MPVVELVKDTSSGVNYTLIAACERWQYSELGVTGYHKSCPNDCWDTLLALLKTADGEEANALKSLLAKLGARVPDTFNHFVNISVAQGGSEAKRNLSFQGPVMKEIRGYYRRLGEGLSSSTCPQYVFDINGKMTVDAHFQVLG